MAPRLTGPAWANWWAEAACRTVDPDLFFPIGTSGPALPQIEKAKRICRTCPAQPPCLAWALGHDGTEGVWGGTTEDERRALRRQRQKAHQGGRMPAVQSINGDTGENTDHVRTLLRRKQPGFAAMLELAGELVESELRSSECSGCQRGRSA